MAYIKFTPEQIKQAQRVDIESFLRKRGEQLKKSGSESEWEWRNGNAKGTVRQNWWYHHHEQPGSKAIDFVRRFYNLDFPDARYLFGYRYARGGANIGNNYFFISVCLDNEITEFIFIIVRFSSSSTFVFSSSMVSFSFS